jgi:hypothetical protein
MDVTWLLHNTSEFNRQSVEWTERDEPNSKRGKTQRSAGKVMASVFWDARGIHIFIDYLAKDQTFNSEYYIALLERLNDEINKKQPHSKKKKSAVSSRQCTVSQINQNDGKIA